ncbi:hypothetical protein TCAL_08775 [Tigriopus californicus]|uniref:Major facilitator superfamily (MFS) profile domain-containing protein n=1 Tax=Tigriopus californicus TaxID=6832 RepID=A0A553PHE9_TIGCA|nr:hypothetical protein TCAL_08775 [Tigriopus californicus]
MIMTEQGSSTSSASSASSNEDEVIAPPRELAPSRSTNPGMCQSQPVSVNPPRSRRCTPILLCPLQPSILDQNTNLSSSDLYEPQSSRPVQELSHHAKKKTSKKISFQEPVGLRAIVEYPYERYQESEEPGSERVWQRQKIRSKSAVVAPSLEPEDVSHRSRESINSIGSYGRKGGGKSRSHSISTIGSFHSQVDPVQIEDLIAMKTQIDELVSILMEKEAKLQELTSNSEDDSAMANNASSSIHPNPMEANFIRSIHSVGATLACLLAGFAMSLLGRRGATLYCTIPAYVCGYLFIGSAPSVWLIILGRFLTGIGLGLTLSVPTVYIVEITNLRVRGTLGVVPNLLCQIGIFATYVSGRWLDWSGLAFLACSVGLPFFLVVWNIPESPIYLSRCGRTEEATRVTTLLDLKTASLPVDCQPKQKLDGETHTILGSIKKLKNPEVWKPFLCGLGLMFFFQVRAN